MLTQQITTRLEFSKITKREEKVQWRQPKSKLGHGCQKEESGGKLLQNEKICPIFRKCS